MTDPVAYVEQKIREALEDEPTCSMCGASTHTEMEETEDGAWTEDCTFQSAFNADGTPRRRARRG